MRARGEVWALVCVVWCGGCGGRTQLDGWPPPERQPDAGTDAGSAIVDAPPDAPVEPDAPAICVPGTTRPVRATADIVFVLDRSGSMATTIEGDDSAPREEWRWSLLESALADAVGVLDERVRVGAALFPNPAGRPRPEVDEGCRTTIGLDVDVSALGTSELLATIRDTVPQGGTPTADAIEEARRSLEASAIARRYLVLATDGAPNCNPDLTTPGCVCTVSATFCDTTGGGTSCLDDLRSIGVVRHAYEDAGIPVYVIGIEDPSRPEFGDVLDEMARVGGRPRDGEGRRFYPMDSAEALRDALSSIVETISMCGFRLASMPEDERDLRILVGGNEVSPSEGGGDGWIWASRDAGEIELVGTACDEVRRGAIVESIVERCG